MKKYIITLIVIVCLSFALEAQINKGWTANELKAANTVTASDSLGPIETEAVLVLNLARLYPKRFIKLELDSFMGTEKYGDYLKKSKYKKTLRTHLYKMKPMPALIPNKKMTESAKCFAIEMGKSGYVGHKRIKCVESIYAECCSYGMVTGKEIILQLLIDHNVPSLGHRIICLSRNYTKIGIAEAAHKKWDTNCVMELI